MNQSPLLKNVGPLCKGPIHTNAMEIKKSFLPHSSLYTCSAPTQPSGMGCPHHLISTQPVKMKHGLVRKLDGNGMPTRTSLAC